MVTAQNAQEKSQWIPGLPRIPLMASRTAISSVGGLHLISTNTVSDDRHSVEDLTEPVNINGGGVLLWCGEG